MFLTYAQTGPTCNPYLTNPRCSRHKKKRRGRNSPPPLREAYSKPRLARRALHGLVAGLFRADSDGFFNHGDEDLAVADLAGFGGLDDG